MLDIDKYISPIYDYIRAAMGKDIVQFSCLAPKTAFLRFLFFYMKFILLKVLKMRFISLLLHPIICFKLFYATSYIALLWRRFSLTISVSFFT